MEKEFDSDEAKKFLLAREKKEKEKWEEERKAVFEKVVAVLKEEFQGSAAEIYLVGSILYPSQFSPHSDVNIVLKNYRGDRFGLWAKLERKIEREIEVVVFEQSYSQELISKNSLKVI